MGAKIKIYLAGPLGFSEAGRLFHAECIIPALKALGHTLLDPWAGADGAGAIAALPIGEKRREAWRAFNLEIGRKNQLAIDACDAMFAVLDGTDVDSGTAAEIGYGFAKGKPILGYRGDFRLSADNEGGIVNLQVEYFIRAGGGDIISAMDQLPDALSKLTRAKLTRD
jgi:nucleoside 2-deoxyribosyltransferase